MFDFSDIEIDEEKLNKILDQYSIVQEDIDTSGVWIDGKFYPFHEIFDLEANND